MGDTLGPGTLIIMQCGSVEPVTNYQDESIALFKAFYQNGCPLTTPEKQAIDAIVILAKEGESIIPKQVYALPIITLAADGLFNRTELIGAQFISLAILEGMPINVIVDTGDPDIILNTTTGNVQMNLAYPDYNGQRLFLNYVK